MKLSISGYRQVKSETETSYANLKICKDTVEDLLLHPNHNHYIRTINGKRELKVCDGWEYFAEEYTEEWREMLKEDIPVDFKE